MPTEKTILLISIRLYRLLLFLYPAEHRREYAPWMAQTFGDLCRASYGQAKLPGLLSLWARVLKDLLATAWAEHVDALGIASLRRQPVAPLPWTKVALAALPGLVILANRLWGEVEFLCLDQERVSACSAVRHLLAWAGLPDTFRAATGSSLLPALLCLALVAGGFVRERRLPAWGFPALGVLLAALPMALMGLLVDPAAGPPPPVYDLVVSRLWPGALWATSLVVVARQRARFRMTVPAWLLLGLLVLLNPLLFMLVGVYLLFPVAIGLLLARRGGLLAGLVVVAGLYWMADGIFDPGYGMLIWSSNYAAELVVSSLPIVSFLILPSIWVLRARSNWERMRGLLLPPAIGLAGGELIHSLVVYNTPGAYSPEMWLLRGAGALDYVIPLVLAAILYLQMSRQPLPLPPPRSDSGADRL